MTNHASNTTSVINTGTNHVIATIPVGNWPYGVVVTPNGEYVYVTNYNSNTVSVINTATNSVTATVPVGSKPCGVAITPDGKKIYVANWGSDTVNAIDTETNEVIATVTVDEGPLALGQFIGSPPSVVTSGTHEQKVIPAPLLTIHYFQ